MRLILHTLLIASIALAMFCDDTRSVAQELKSAAQAAAGSPALNAAQYHGSLECSRCHANPSPVDKVQKITNFVALDEFKRWLDTDIHARSFLQIIPNRDFFGSMSQGYANLQDAAGDETLRTKIEWGLSNDLSHEMCKKLGYDPDTLGSENLEGTQFARDCLTCHAGYDAHKDFLVDEVKQFGVGVGCEACHGPSQDWYEPHTKTDWRKIDPLEKSKLGMVDVRNPAVRTSQCLSCHVGNESEHKVVTHRMYAAGHPQLPGVEVESFSQQTSRHWRPLGEKSEFKFRDEFASINRLDVNDFSESRTAAIGNLVSLRDSLKLVVDTAASESRAWPEFSSFDCAACHHDLQSDSWRQQRGFRGRPGRPLLHAWPETLVRAGLVVVANKRGLSVEDSQALLGEYDTCRADLQNLLDDQPFGEADKLADATSEGAATKLIACLDNLIWEDKTNRRLAVENFNRSDAVEMLKLLCGTKPVLFDPEEAVFDFNSARQLSWSINVVANELSRRTIASDSEYDRERLEAELLELDEEMLLSLPGGSVFYHDPDEEAKSSSLRFIKTDNCGKAYFERKSDRTTRTFDLRDLSPEAKSVIEGGFGKITVEQQKFYAAIYDFDRKDFLKRIETLRACFP